MIKIDFLKNWEKDKSQYLAWGQYLVDQISNVLKSEAIDVDVFFKIPPQPRLKTDKSLLDKAFSRGKGYKDPYNDIEDKVGARFVVLLIEDIQKIEDIICVSDMWTATQCKHFDEDKKREPNLFTYQSVHYIIKPKQELLIGGVGVDESVKCEIQIRTLLQHAHSELTHDTIYKPNKAKIKPEIYRTVAKSMALIETTDDFFTSVVKELKNSPRFSNNFKNRLDSLYFNVTGNQSVDLKSSFYIWEALEELIDDNMYENIITEIKEIGADNIASSIKLKYRYNSLYQQSIVLFLYGLLNNKVHQLRECWPFEMTHLVEIAGDLGIAFDPYE